MTHPIGLLFRRALWCACLAFAFQAAPVAAETVGGEGWDAGVRVNGFTMDPFLGSFYDDKEAVSGVMFGGFATRRMAAGQRLTFGATYAQTRPKDGMWLEAGEDASAAEWTVFRGTNIVDLHAIYGKEFGFGPFGWFVGGGLGIAIPMGTITSYEVDAMGNPIAATADEKEIPPVIPTVILRTGPSVMLGDRIHLQVDVGIHDGLYGGTSIGARF